MWQDHVVTCKNKTGETAEFVYMKHVNTWTEKKEPRQKSGSLASQGNIWCSKGFNGWGHCSKKWWTGRGWDVRPLEMQENKPFDKAVLAYNPQNDIYTWFIDEADSPKREKDTWKPPRPLGEHYKGSLWNLTNDTHGTKEHWETKRGWVFPDTKKKEETVKDVLDLQEKLIDHCAQKLARAEHLKSLTRLGALNPNATYDEVAEIITNYLNTESNACAEGKDRALEALGLVTKQWVKKAMSVNDIYDNCYMVDYWFDTKKGRYPCSKVKANQISSLPGLVILDVWVQE